LRNGGDSTYVEVTMLYSVEVVPWNGTQHLYHSNYYITVHTVMHGA